jgi:hypothetical protein
MGREQELDKHAPHYTQPKWVEGRATTAELAARTAQMWLTNPVNKMQLPELLMFADKDGSGTIDKDEVRITAPGVHEPLSCLGHTSRACLCRSVPSLVAAGDVTSAHGTFSYVWRVRVCVLSLCLPYACSSVLAHTPRGAHSSRSCSRRRAPTSTESQT